MKLLKIIIFFLLILFSAAPPILAGNFAWTDDFNILAAADPSGLTARLSARFNLGDVQVKAILSNFDTPADAYLALRLGEMSGHPPGFVIERYKQDKEKGWGILAKNLGIKPGSDKFQALKNGQDLYGSRKQESVRGRDMEHGYANKVDNGHQKNNRRWKK